MLVIGPHMSIAKGYAKTVQHANKIGANTFQFFSRNPRGSHFRAESEKDIAVFQRLRREYGFGKLQAHAPYTMNLASPSEKVYEFSNMVIREDVARMDALGIEYLCLHPGSHLGSGAVRGIARISEGLNQGITGKEQITVLLETMPGKGTEIGFCFSHLREILEGISHKERMGVCMDLCHVFSAGYDIQNDLDGVLAKFDKIVGIGWLRSIHLNDSIMPLASRKDRHCPVGQGEIGLQAIIDVLLNPYLKNLPFFTETPLDEEGHRKEIAMLRERVGEKG